MILETDLSFSSHVKAANKSAYYHLKNIARIRCFVSSQTCSCLCHQQVDYCNGLLPKKTIRQLQLIQNTAAWTLTRTRTSEHITPVLSPTSVIKHRVNRYFLVLHPNWKTKNTKKINQSKPVKPFLLGMKECGLLVPKQKRQRVKNVHFSIGNKTNNKNHFHFHLIKTLQAFRPINCNDLISTTIQITNKLYRERKQRTQRSFLKLQIS